jgi:hypothetical protein
MIFDALLQSGFLGALGAVYITVYAAKVYLKGMSSGDYRNIVAAAFVAPALVRIFTAGSGMLHITDLTGICIAVNLGWYYKAKAG